MERESFENQARSADFLNAHFVSIKVDREERPDVDKIYMTAVQAMSGQGGWPLNCFLTPDLKPFYGGTYFPPEDKYGHASFMQVLRQIAKLWERAAPGAGDGAGIFTKSWKVSRRATRRPAALARLADQCRRNLQTGVRPGIRRLRRRAQIPAPQRTGCSCCVTACAPGDPRPPKWSCTPATAWRRAASTTRLGGGFSRYSVDAQWLVPHFEKMLYDNAQLVNLYLDAWLVSGAARHAETARGHHSTMSCAT
jgi:uncharacterized protein YyaL (SSP411 family)